MADTRGHFAIVFGKIVFVQGNEHHEIGWVSTEDFGRGIAALMVDVANADSKLRLRAPALLRAAKEETPNGHR